MISTEVTKHLAQLSRLSFKEDELAEMTNQMSDNIALMDKVCDFDNNVKTYAPKEEKFNNLRCDKPRNSYPTEEIIGNSKAVRDNCFVVPKVV